MSARVDLLDDRENRPDGRLIALLLGEESNSGEKAILVGDQSTDVTSGSVTGVDSDRTIVNARPSTRRALFIIEHQNRLIWLVGFFDFAAATAGGFRFSSSLHVGHMIDASSATPLRPLVVMKKT